MGQIGKVHGPFLPLFAVLNRRHLLACHSWVVSPQEIRFYMAWVGSPWILHVFISCYIPLINDGLFICFKHNMKNNNHNQNYKKWWMIGLLINPGSPSSLLQLGYRRPGPHLETLQRRSQARLVSNPISERRGRRIYGSNKLWLVVGDLMVI